MLTLFADRLTAVLTSRFLLDLQEASKTEVQHDEADQSAPSSTRFGSAMSFANVIGSLDAEIGPIFHLGSGKDSSGEISDGSDTSIELLPTGLAESERIS